LLEINDIDILNVMNDTNNITICLQILEIIVNFIIAIIAVFGERIKGLFLKPKLNLSITSLFPDCNLTAFPNGQRAFFFRIAVTNNGTVDANNVQLYLNGIKKKGLDGIFSACNHILPMNLLWSYQDNEPTKTSIAQIISPGMKKYCDFIYSIENTNNCFLCTEVPLLSYGLPTNLIDKGVYVASISVVSSNTKSKTIEIQFEYTGFWTTNAEEIIKINS
jgi:hypothetical protein